mmetsp:Transcript_136376/g.323011  ORF Transcript_136376/g.323011 Transcript_136376/m.323011 type:complete len:179 (-) Transcript_136376:140-676(-)
MSSEAVGGMHGLNKARNILQPTRDVAPVLAKRGKTEDSDASTATDVESHESRDGRSLEASVDVIIAVEEGCSRMAFERHAAKSGLSDQDVTLCTCMADLIWAVEVGVVSNLAKPLAVVVGEASWLAEFPAVWRGRLPYVIDASCCDSGNLGDEVLLASCSHQEFQDALWRCVERCAYA